MKPFSGTQIKIFVKLRNYCILISFLVFTATWNFPLAQMDIIQTKRT